MDQRSAPVVDMQHVFSLRNAEDIGRSLGSKFDTYGPADLQIGMDVELEHGKRGGPYNLTNDDARQTAMIALAHLSERGDYYERLEKAEGDSFIFSRTEFIGLIIAIAVLTVIIIMVLHFWMRHAKSTVTSERTPVSVPGAN